MHNWEMLLISPTATLAEAIEVIDKGGVRIALVVDSANKLLGVLTDGDIRRGLLKHVKMKDSIQGIMNQTPITAGLEISSVRLLVIMKEKSLAQIPIVDRQGRVQGLKILDELLNPERYDNLVVLMAGGLGSRLGALTKECPKPLLEICGKPILELILEKFIDAGFHNFVISINYMGHVIQDYFADGKNHGVHIEYISEEKKLGTAGPLSLLSKKLDRPFVVMNGDVLTSVDFRSLLVFHKVHHSHATMCVKKYENQVPYGVIRTNESNIIAIDEKPIQTHFVNAGIYVLDPAVLEHIPYNTYYDMTDLFNNAVSNQLRVNAFPIREYWTDIGQVDELSRAREDYVEGCLL